MKKRWWFFSVVFVFALVYVLGPQVESPTFDAAPITFEEPIEKVEASIEAEEAANPAIKPDNQSQFIWYDSSKSKTPYSIVYLHGWSASQVEGAPTHKEVATTFGCNLYLPRLAGHGLMEEEPMLNITADALMQSAKEAIAVGKLMGDSVILMTTSTGGTLGLYLAGEDPRVAGVILYSPNIEIFDQMSHLLNNPWGLQLARLVTGGKYHQWELDSTRKQYWTNKYRLEALTQLRELVDVTMTEETFQKVTQPVFLGYYYKSDQAMDSTVSVPAMQTMFSQLGTPENLKMEIEFPEAGHHVIGSSLTSHQLEDVIEATNEFLQQKMNLKKVAPTDSLTLQKVDQNQL